MRIFLMILAVLALLIGVACTFLTDIVQGRILAALEQHHVPVTSLTVSSVTPTSVTLSNVALGKGDALKAKEIVLAYRGGTSLQTLRVRVALDGLALNAAQVGNAWALGGIEQLWGPQVLGAPTATIALSGNVDITGDATKDVDGDATFDKAVYQAAGQRITAEKARFDLSTSSGVLSIDSDIGALNLQQNGAAMLAPLAVESEAKFNWAKRSLSHKDTIANLQKTLRINLNGMHDVARQSGTATVQSNDLEFGPGKLLLAELAPGFAQGVATPPMQLKLEPTDVRYSASGTPEAKGTLTLASVPVGSLVAQALGKGATMDGTLKGAVPFLYRSAQDWRLNNATLENVGPMKLTLLPAVKELGNLVGGITAMLGKKNPIPQGDVNVINVQTLKLALNSTNGQGGLAIAGELEGTNAMLKKPVSMRSNFVSSLSELLANSAASALKKAAGN